MGRIDGLARSKGLEKRIIRVGVWRERVATIMRGTVINGAKLGGIGGQKLGALGTNGSQSLDLGRYIYTFGFLFTSGIGDLLGTI